MKIETVCRFCDQECPVTIELDEKNNPIKVKHEELKKGRFCAGGLNALEILTNPKRLKTPMIAEKDEKGEKHFRSASWEEALKLVAEKFQYSSEKYGKESLLAISGFNKPVHSMAYRRFCNVIGIINRVGTGNMCHMVQGLAAKHTFGTALKPDVSKDTQTIVLWGSNPTNTMRWDAKTLLDAVRNGKKLVLVDPIPGVYAKRANVWLPIIPGTDMALIFGMIHIVLNEGWYEEEFIEKYTEGFAELQSAIASYTPEFVAKECGLSIDEIYEATRMIAKERPVAFMYGNALHHNHDSYQKCRAMAILIALTGNIDISGGMLATPGMSSAKLECMKKMTREELFPREMLAKSLGYEKYNLKEFVMLGGNEAVEAINDGKIHAPYVHAANPVLQWADSRETAKALGSLDFMVVSDFFMTPTATQADVVLPAATYLEYESIIVDKKENLQYSPAVYQQYNVLPDFEILRRLAEAMGKGAEFWTDSEEYWEMFAESYGSSLQEVRKQGYVETTVVPDTFRVRSFRENGFPTRNGKINLALPKEEYKVDSLPVYEPMEAITEAYPLRYSTYKPGSFFGGAGQCIETQKKMQNQPLSYIGKKTAERYGVQDGEKIRVITPTGSCVQTVKVLKRMASNTIVLANACWISEEENWEEQLNSCANNLSSLHQGIGKDIPAFSCRGVACQIEKC